MAELTPQQEEEAADRMLDAQIDEHLEQEREARSGQVPPEPDEVQTFYDPDEYPAVWPAYGVDSSTSPPEPDEPPFGGPQEGEIPT